MNLQRVWLLIAVMFLVGAVAAVLLQSPVGDDLPQGPLVTVGTVGPATPYQVDENDP